MAWHWCTLWFSRQHTPSAAAESGGCCPATEHFGLSGRGDKFTTCFRSSWLHFPQEHPPSPSLAAIYNQFYSITGLLRCTPWQLLAHTEKVEPLLSSHTVATNVDTNLLYSSDTAECQMGTLLFLNYSCSKTGQGQ